MTDSASALRHALGSVLLYGLVAGGAVAANGLGGPGGPDDCNGNGIEDSEDIASGTSLDCNGDGLPDECQPCLDPDGNGLLDPCEAAFANGLVGQYWNSLNGSGNFSERFLSRVDAEIDFVFDNAPELPDSNFSVRWTGLIVPPASGTYTFWTTTDDGVRLWIDGDLIIDRWQSQSPTTWSGSIALDGNVPVTIVMEYFEGGGGALARLEWRPPGDERAVVPTEALRPMVDLDGDGWSDAAGDCDLDGIVDPQRILDGDADCNGNCIPDACEVAPASPQAYWRFEKGAGAFDSGPYALAANAFGTAAQIDVAVPIIPQTEAINGLARSFGGTSRIVVEDPDGRLSFGNEGFTIEAWVRVDPPFGPAPPVPPRQMLLQRKPLDAGDAQLEYALYARGGDVADATTWTYGRTEGITGREVVLRFGNGSDSTWAAISNFTLVDGTWHFISVAFDPTRSIVRFGLDGLFEEIEVDPRNRAGSGGPIVIGAHTNASGGFNQHFDGDLDELRIVRGVLPPQRLLADPRGLDCNGNGVPDECDIADGLSSDCNFDGSPDQCDPDCDGDGISDVCEVLFGTETDCNGNGVIDACEIAANPSIDCDGDGLPDECQLASEDCNGNGVVDACDLANGIGSDCNGDLVLDECQLGEPFEYRLDDGGAEFGIRSEGTHMAWLSQYRVEGGASVIEAIEMVFVFLPENKPANIGVWSDPNGDGVPDDAQLLVSRSVNTTPRGVLRTFDIEDVDVGPDGTSFFVGAWCSVTSDDFPGALDTSGNTVIGRCWLVGRDGPIDPNDLAGGALAFETIEQALFPGKWQIRARSTSTSDDCNGNLRPDACDIADGTSVDLDGSGRPDECEDCNMNGVLDSIDIASGASGDCDGDGVPDECQALYEDCDGNGIPDVCDLVENDCNGNGVPDACDIAAGLSEDLDGTGIPDECEDCNGNGELDSYDISIGNSLDCNGDLVPDECQFGTPPLDVEYLVDDGTREGNYGATGIVDYIWLNHFVVEPGGEWIAEIRVVLGNAFAGTPYQVALWDDPNGDGAPDDASVIATAPAIAANGNSNVFNATSIVPTFVGPAGTSFFAGVIYRDEFGNQFPVGVDTDLPIAEQSWVAISPMVDPNNLSDAAIYGYLYVANALIRAYGSDGVLPLDCNGNGVPDDCDIADGLEGDANGNGIPDSCEGCVADLDGDGLVGAGDLAIVLASWSIDGSCGGCEGDLDGDGVVDAGDLASVLAAWGACGP